MPLAASSLDAVGVWRIDGNQATRQQIRSGNIGQRSEAGNCLPDVVQGVRRLRDFVPERLGCQIVPGPQRRIATACIAGDLVTIRERENRIENRAVR